MIELTGLGSAIRAFGVLYWLLAIGLLSFVLWKSKGPIKKAVWAIVVIAIFSYLPVTRGIEQAKRDAFAREAWAYFKKKCDTEAGEKIYKTVSGVTSVLVVKPLPSATEKDNYNQFWFGDPYSAAATSSRSMYAATRLTMDRKHRNGTSIQRGLDFVEIKNPTDNSYLRIYRAESNKSSAAREKIENTTSKFGVLWEDISTPEDRQYWVAGSRFRVVDLSDQSIVAERVGFLIESGFGSVAGARRPWLVARGFGPNGRSCPAAHDATDMWFLARVFERDQEK